MAAARRPDQRNRIPADPAPTQGAPHMAINPADVARRHVDEELMEIATAKAEAAMEAIARAQPGQDREYLTAKAERWQKWAATAQKQMELKQ
ncbi:MAG: hypothetical protein ACK5X3_08285 [Pseudomonadota bacterium]